MKEEKDNSREKLKELFDKNNANKKKLMAKVAEYNILCVKYNEHKSASSQLKRQSTSIRDLDAVNKKLEQYKKELLRHKENEKVNETYRKKISEK